MFDSARKNEAIPCVSWLSATLASTIDICPIVLFRNENTETVARIQGFNNAIDHLIHAVCKQIERKNLFTPFVALSYAGDLENIRTRTSYLNLVDKAEIAKTQVLLAKMSLTNTVHMGLGGFTIGVCCEHPPI